MLLYEGVCVEFERKNSTKLVFLLLNCPQALKSFVTASLNLTCGDLGICLLV